MESESLNFDPAMFDMKSDHGALLPAGDETKSSGSSRGRGRGRGGAQARGRGGRAGFPTGSNTVPAGHVDDVRAAQRGQGNNGSRGRGRGAYKGDGDRPQKRVRTNDDDAGGMETAKQPSRFFKMSMMEDPWKHLS